MPQSITRYAIGEISKAAMAGGLKELGFRRQANHLHRKSADLFHGIHFQASQWGVNEIGSFTINIKIVWETQLQREFGYRFPSNPATALEPVAIRIGSLMPDKSDHWWDVDSSTDQTALCESVVAALKEYAVPYFDKLADRESVLDCLRNGGTNLGFHETTVPIQCAIIAHDLGYMREAQDSMRMATQVCDNAHTRAQIEHLAKTLKLSIK